MLLLAPPLVTSRWRRDLGDNKLRKSGAKAFAAFTMTFALLRTAQAQFDPYDGGLFGPPMPMTEKIAIDVVAALLGFLIGAIFSPLLAPIRRIGYLVIAALVIAFAWFVRSRGADFSTDVVATLGFFIAFGYGIGLGAAALRQAREQAERPTSYGSAKWATAEYLQGKGLFKRSGFLLGEFHDNNRNYPLFYNGTRHLLTVAPTRSGKGVSSIIPNLLTYEGSALVIDPKGENAMITAKRRGGGDKARDVPGLGHEIHLLDPWNIAAGKLGLKASRFNPLEWINGDDPDVIENAFILADALVHGSDSGGEGKFWEAESKALLVGLILYVATSEHEKGSRTLARVRDILTLKASEFDKVLERMFAERNPVISTTAARTASKEPKLRGNVLAATQSETHFLDSPRIRESLSVSDFRFEDLKTKPMTIFLILPADRLQTFDRWIRLLMQQALTVNARNIAVKPKRPVLFLLDEMAALGRLTMLEQAYGLMAGFGMQLWGIVQDLSQLERIYGKGWQTFISNAGVIQYFGSRDEHTASYFSKLCGVTTVRIFSFSYALTRAFGTTSGTSSTTGEKSSNSSSWGTSEGTTFGYTTNANESQRQLAYADELMVLREDSQIVFVENLDPIRAAKVRWYAHDDLKRLGGAIDAAPVPGGGPAPQPSKVTSTVKPDRSVVTFEEAKASLAIQAARAKEAKASLDRQQAREIVARLNASLALGKAETAPAPRSPATSGQSPPKEPAPSPKAPTPKQPVIVEEAAFTSKSFGNIPVKIYSDGSVVIETAAGPYRFRDRQSAKNYLSNQ